MFQSQFQALATRLLNEQNYTGATYVPVTINTRLRTVGARACWRRGVPSIEVSAWILKAPEAEQDNALRHEVAHILAGPYAKHNAVWKSWARRVGCTGDRCYSAEVATLNLAAPKRVMYRCTAGVCELKFAKRPAKDYTHSAYRCRAHMARFNIVGHNWS